MENKHELPDELLKKIQMVRQKFGSFASRQPEIDKNEYFSHTQENFQSFALSRHSCRYFSGTAPKNVLQDAVILANKISPSACNRQAVRVHLIDDYDIVQKILIFQGGCRGFHEDIGQILMIAVDMEYTMHIKEYHDLYLNAGLYLMNLAYALHFHRIGSCFLTWSVTPEIDKKTRSLVQIPDQEEIVHILAVGEVPEIFRLAFSEKTFGQKLQEHGAI